LNNGNSYHIPVLLNEAIEYLINADVENRIIVDGTLGGGGYTELICNKIKENDKIISIDKDLNAIEYSKQVLSSCSNRITFLNGNFGDLKEILTEMNIKKIDGLVLDLGLSTYQLDAEDGFSFMNDTPLDMRAYKGENQTAAEILNSYTKDELTRVFEEYGDIGKAQRLSKAIVNRRKSVRFSTTFDLVNLVQEEYKINKKNLIDFLAKIFQSLRIEVNNELENLETVLEDSIQLINVGGRIVIVSYHSLEDRMVKNFFKEKSSTTRQTDNPYFTEDKLPEIKILTKKPVVPSPEEIKFNSRSRSAKLRAAEIL